MEFRNVRHTDQLTEIRAFYTEVIGLEVLFSFDEHNGYSGVFLGKQGQDWHLAFTSTTAKADHHFDEDDLLVFYPETRAEYDAICSRIEANSLPQLTARNPYWAGKSVMIQDPDGYGVIVSHEKAE